MPATKDLWDCAQELMRPHSDSVLGDLTVSRSGTGFVAKLDRDAMLDVVETPSGGFDVRLTMYGNANLHYLIGSYSNLDELADALWRHYTEIARGEYGDIALDDDFVY